MAACGVVRVMIIRPAQGVRRFLKTRGSSRVGPGGDRNAMGQLVSGQEFFKSHGSGQATRFRSDPQEVNRPVEESFHGR